MTELELHALRTMPELEAAQQLIALDTNTLRYVAQFQCYSTCKKGADKHSLVAAILDYTHPRSAPAAPAIVVEQLAF